MDKTVMLTEILQENGKHIYVVMSPEQYDFNNRNHSIKISKVHSLRIAVTCLQKREHSLHKIRSCL